MIFYTYFDDASTGNTQISAIKNINPNQKDNPILSRVLLAMTPQIKQWGTTDAPINKVVQVSFPIAFNNPNWIACGIGNNRKTDFSDNIVTLCKEQSSVSTICFHTVHESAPSVTFLAIGI